MKQDLKAEAALLKKFKDDKFAVSAKDARALLDAKGKDSVDEQVESAKKAIQDSIKEAAIQGLGYVTITVGHHHPAVREAVESWLSKAGFRYDVQGASGYIYW